MAKQATAQKSGSPNLSQHNELPASGLSGAQQHVAQTENNRTRFQSRLHVQTTMVTSGELRSSLTASKQAAQGKEDHGQQQQASQEEEQEPQEQQQASQEEEQEPQEQEEEEQQQTSEMEMRNQMQSAGTAGRSEEMLKKVQQAEETVKKAQWIFRVFNLAQGISIVDIPGAILTANLQLIFGNMLHGAILLRFPPLGKIEKRLVVIIDFLFFLLVLLVISLIFYFFSFFL